MDNSSLQNKTAATIFMQSASRLSDAASNAEGYFFEENGQCPRWLIYAFLTLFFMGSCANWLESLALFRCKKNGVLSIILQITLADGILFFVAVIELLTSYYQTWKFTNQTCMVYKGTEIFANTLIVYLLVCLNFHIITFWNLHNVETVKNNKNPLTSFNESSSSECLVTRSETRIVTIDYKKRRNDVPVAIPIIFLWILCLSISLPKYILSSTLELQGKHLCIILHNTYGKILHSLLIIFSVIVPCFLLFISLLILIYKLSKTSQRNIDNVLTKQFDEIRSLLIFSIIFTLFYMATSYQKHVCNMSVTMKQIFILEKYYYNNVCNVYQTMIHYSGTTLRGILCYYTLPNLKQAVKDKLFCYNKEN